MPDWPSMRLSHVIYIDHVRTNGERLAAVAVDHLRARLVTGTQ